MKNNRNARPASLSPDVFDMARSLTTRMGQNDNHPYNNTGEPDDFLDIEMFEREGYWTYLNSQVGNEVINKIREENSTTQLGSKINNSVLLQHFEGHRIENRFIFLHNLMTQFLELSGLKDKLYICESKLDHVVIDYFADIYRLKTFHSIDRVSRQTIYAYLAFWIVRRQPLQVLKDHANEEGCVFANENFATSLLAYYFTTPSGQPNSGQLKSGQPNQIYSVDGNLRSISASPNTFGELQDRIRYHLKYRLMDAHNLELLIASYEVGYRVDSRHVKES